MNFDAAKFPHIKFESTSFVKDGNNCKLTGHLTLKDGPKPAALAAGYDGSTISTATTRPASR